MKGVCPRCGIAYQKWRGDGESSSAHPSESQPDTEFTCEAVIPLHKRLLTHFMQAPKRVDSTSWVWRATLTALFTLWGGSFIIGGVDWESIGSSFLHNVNLPFHEFGHVLFMPFGRFMTILGGSLFQILLPLIFLWAFSFQQRDNFAASIMLWWCGQNFIDVAPYIKDAPYRTIPLIRGMGEEAHDWGNLLTMTGQLDSANTLANMSFAMGSLIIVLAMIWAIALTLKIKRLADSADNL